MLQEQEYPGLLIAAARRSIKQAVLRHARPLRLTAQQFWFVNAAQELPSATLGELARRQRMDAPTASRLAVNLARRGLVRVAPDADDRRAVRVALTPAGLRLAARIAPIAEAMRFALVRGMSLREQQALRASLRKIAQNADIFAAAGSAKEPGGAREAGSAKPVAGGRP